MSIMGALPPKPNPNSVNFDDPKSAAIFQQKMADYNFALQCLKSAQDEENSTRSNMHKSSHDALMNTISNMK